MIIGEDGKPPLDYLAHHGVKGMHWGVRKEAQNNVKVLANQMEGRKAFVTREISEEEYKNLSASPIKLGKDFKRIANNTDLRSIVYATNNENDSTRYKALFQRTNDRHELSIHTNKEAISPGMKERVDTYIKTLDKKLPDGQTNRQLYFDSNKVAAALSTRELGLKTYQSFAQTQHMNLSIHSAYFDELKKKGYTAVLDDADRKFIAETPVIIFPDKAGARVTEFKKISKHELLESKRKAKLLSADDINHAQRHLKIK